MAVATVAFLTEGQSLLQNPFGRQDVPFSGTSKSHANPHLRLPNAMCTNRAKGPRCYLAKATAPSDTLVFLNKPH